MYEIVTTLLMTYQFINMPMHLLHKFKQVFFILCSYSVLVQISFDVKMFWFDSELKV